MRKDEDGGPKIWSVSQLAQYIRELLEKDRILSNVWVKGEIADYRCYQKSGHLYFTLKDEEASLSCVMFKSRAKMLGFEPQDGIKVIVLGYVSMFDKYGRCQLYVEEMQPDGLGSLFLRLNYLKEKLEKEGLFDPQRKKKLPLYVKCVGVVTSLDGAAFRDIVRVIKQRHPGCEVVIAPASVQGAEAPYEIAQAIRDMNEWGKPDVIIVGRGGGSLEDLLAFSSEEVVRAVASSRIPVISAVGHEIDYSLADLAADVRAATPTQAAVLAVPDVTALRDELKNCLASMKRSIYLACNSRWEQLDYLRERRLWMDPEGLTRNLAVKMQFLLKAWLSRMESRLALDRSELNHLGIALDTLSPLKVLKRGYAMAIRPSGEVVRSVGDAVLEEELILKLWDGELGVVVRGKRWLEWKT